jgi:hypothetical protein
MKRLETLREILRVTGLLRGGFSRAMQDVTDRRKELRDRKLQAPHDWGTYLGALQERFSVVLRVSRDLSQAVSQSTDATESVIAVVVSAEKRFFEIQTGLCSPDFFASVPEELAATSRKFSAECRPLLETGLALCRDYLSAKES